MSTSLSFFQPNGEQKYRHEQVLVKDWSLKTDMHRYIFRDDGRITRVYEKWNGKIVDNCWCCQHCQHSKICHISSHPKYEKYLWNTKNIKKNHFVFLFLFLIFFAAFNVFKLGSASELEWQRKCPGFQFQKNARTNHFWCQWWDQASASVSPNDRKVSSEPADPIRQTTVAGGTKSIRGL